MNFVAGIIEGLCSALFVPLANYPSLALTIAAAILGIVCALLYGKFSPQKRLKAVKRGIAAEFLRVLVFRRDLKTMLAAQLALLWGGVKYLLVSVPPIAVLLVPMVLILSEMNLWLGYRALKPGESALIEVQLSQLQARAATSLALTPLSSEMSVSAPVRQGKLGLGSWMLTATAQGAPQIRLATQQSSLDLPISVSESPALQRLAPNYSSDFWQQLMMPTGNASVNIQSPFEQVSLELPQRELNFFGWQTGWLAPFFILTIAFGYLAARLAKIEV